MDRRVDINLSQGRGSIRVDGVEVPHVSQLSVHSHPGEPTHIELEVVTIDFNAELDKALPDYQVYIGGITGHGETLRDAVFNVYEQLVEKEAAA